MRKKEWIRFSERGFDGRDISKHKVIAILRNVPEKELQAYAESFMKAEYGHLKCHLHYGTCRKSDRLYEKETAGRFFSGCGTVLNEREVKKQRQAGADFMLSPSTLSEGDGILCKTRDRIHAWCIDPI